MNFEEQKIRYAYNGKPQQWQWGFKSGWNARQSEIDELKAQLECCRKENAVLLGKVDELQGQLENMEACYIEKKKQVDAVSQVLCELKESLKGFQEMDLYDKGHRVTTEYVIADLEQALRGEHEKI